MYLQTKLFALVPLFTSMMLNTWFGVLGNNSIWTSLNDTAHAFFIDEHCTAFGKLIVLTFNLDMYCVKMLLLLRTAHFFKNIPALQLGRASRLVLFCVLTATTTLFCVLVLADAEFKATIFRTGAHKQCEPTVLEAEGGDLNLYPALMFSQSACLHAVIVVICVNKLFRFKRTPLEDSVSIAKGYVVRFLWLAVGVIFSQWMCFAVLLRLRVVLFPVAMMVKIALILFSFDVRFCSWSNSELQSERDYDLRVGQL